MAKKKHDERKDVEHLSNIPGVSVNPGQKQIKINPTATVGIHSWGRIDFLTHYCGYSAMKG